MKVDKIKPIPKSIIAEIKKRETTPDGHTRYYSYLATNDRELVKITVAVKHKNKQMYYKQCAVHGIKSDECFVKDMCFTYIGGYQTGWHYEGLTKDKKWYEDGEWGTADVKYFDVYAPILNIEFLARYDQYKYSAYELYPYTDILQYLKLYEQYPQTEYLIKFGLSHYVQYKQILKKISKDKTFQKWLFNNHSLLASKNYYVSSILKAYKENKPLDVVQTYEEQIKQLSNKDFKPIRELFGKNICKYIDYVNSKHISHRLYLDYLTACNYLEMDMNEDKNRLPHDFDYWHDVRTDEYRTAKALKDAEERKAMYDKFSKVADKYSKLQYNSNGAYMIVIAKSPDELKTEGRKLNHCVGSMNYDQKFIKEESLIFFVRTKDNPTEPFVTVEYSIESKKVLQCYAKGNTKPDEEVTTFINTMWNPYASKALKKMVAQKGVETE
jgi:hypothetical protein